jgi:hypothetical protein
MTSDRCRRKRGGGIFSTVWIEVFRKTAGGTLEHFVAAVKVGVEDMNKAEQQRWNTRYVGTPKAAVGDEGLWRQNLDAFIPIKPDVTTVQAALVEIAASVKLMDIGDLFKKKIGRGFAPENGNLKSYQSVRGKWVYQMVIPV